MYEILGWIATSLLVLAWVPATVKAIRKKKSTMDVSFSLIMFVACFFFVIYGFYIEDMVIVSLNVGVGFFALINFYLIPKKIAKLEADIEHAEEVLKEEVEEVEEKLGLK